MTRMLLKSSMCYLLKIKLKNNLFALILHRVQDDLIDELFYRGAIIGEKDGAAAFLAHFPELDAVRCHLHEQGVRQGIDVILEIAQRGVGVGADDHGIGETLGIDEVDIWEDRVH